MEAQTPKRLPSGVPHCLKKRRLLNEPELSPEVCRGYARKFLEMGWWEDALEFFQKAQDARGLEEIKTQALKTGDGYLLARTGEKDPDLWRRLGEQALALGKLHFAWRAFEAVGDEDQTAMVAALIAGAAAANPDV